MSQVPSASLSLTQLSASRMNSPSSHRMDSTAISSSSTLSSMLPSTLSGHYCPQLNWRSWAQLSSVTATKMTRCISFGPLMVCQSLACHLPQTKVTFFLSLSGWLHSVLGFNKLNQHRSSLSISVLWIQLLCIWILIFAQIWIRIQAFHTVTISILFM